MYLFCHLKIRVIRPFFFFTRNLIHVYSNRITDINVVGRTITAMFLKTDNFSLPNSLIDMPNSLIDILFCRAASHWVNFSPY